MLKKLRAPFTEAHLAAAVPAAVDTRLLLTVLIIRVGWVIDYPAGSSTATPDSAGVRLNGDCHTTLLPRPLPPAAQPFGTHHDARRSLGCQGRFTGRRRRRAGG